MLVPVPNQSADQASVPQTRLGDSQMVGITELRDLIGAKDWVALLKVTEGPVNSALSGGFNTSLAEAVQSEEYLARVGKAYFIALVNLDQTDKIEKIGQRYNKSNIQSRLLREFLSESLQQIDTAHQPHDPIKEVRRLRQRLLELASDLQRTGSPLEILLCGTLAKLLFRIIKKDPHPFSPTEIADSVSTLTIVAESVPYGDFCEIKNCVKGYRSYLNNLLDPEKRQVFQIHNLDDKEALANFANENLCPPLTQLLAVAFITKAQNLDVKSGDACFPAVLPYLRDFICRKWKTANASDITRLRWAFPQVALASEAEIAISIRKKDVEKAQAPLVDLITATLVMLKIDDPNNVDFTPFRVAVNSLCDAYVEDFKFKPVEIWFSTSSFQEVVTAYFRRTPNNHLEARTWITFFDNLTAIDGKLASWLAGNIEIAEQKVTLREKFPVSDPNIAAKKLARAHTELGRRYLKQGETESAIKSLNNAYAAVHSSEPLTRLMVLGWEAKTILFTPGGWKAWQIPNSTSSHKKYDKWDTEAANANDDNAESKIWDGAFKELFLACRNSDSSTLSSTYLTNGLLALCLPTNCGSYGTLTVPLAMDQLTRFVRSQAGFTPGKAKVWAISCLQRLLEISRELSN